MGPCVGCGDLLLGPAPQARAVFPNAIHHGGVEQRGMGFLLEALGLVASAVGAVGPAALPILGGNAAEREQKRYERNQQALNAQLREEAESRAQQGQLATMNLVAGALGLALVGGSLYVAAQALSGSSSKKKRRTR